MEALIHLDTHVVVWLYLRDEARLAPALPHLRGRRPVMSPMALLELQYLYEVGRTHAPAQEVFANLGRTIGLRLATPSFPEVARQALALTWTRDPFDRLIVATALADEAGLLTRDREILEHVEGARWG